jgi:hypothetical protein
MATSSGGVALIPISSIPVYFMSLHQQRCNDEYSTTVLEECKRSVRTTLELTRFHYAPRSTFCAQPLAGRARGDMRRTWPPTWSHHTCRPGHSQRFSEISSQLTEESFSPRSRSLPIRPYRAAWSETVPVRMVTDPSICVMVIPSNHSVHCLSRWSSMRMTTCCTALLPGRVRSVSPCPAQAAGFSSGYPLPCRTAGAARTRDVRSDRRRG